VVCHEFLLGCWLEELDGRGLGLLYEGCLAGATSIGCEEIPPGLVDLEREGQHRLATSCIIIVCSRTHLHKPRKLRLVEPSGHWRDELFIDIALILVGGVAHRTVLDLEEHAVG
jgi:hypothetical protein